MCNVIMAICLTVHNSYFVTHVKRFEARRTQYASLISHLIRTESLQNILFVQRMSLVSNIRVLN